MHAYDHGLSMAESDLRSHRGGVWCCGCSLDRLACITDGTHCWIRRASGGALLLCKLGPCLQTPGSPARCATGTFIARESELGSERPGPNPQKIRSQGSGSSDGLRFTTYEPGFTFS